MHSTQLSPREGVVFVPDIEKSERIGGKPFMKTQKEFQRTFLENRGRKHHIPNAGKEEVTFDANKEEIQDYVLEYGKFLNIICSFHPRNPR